MAKKTLERMDLMVSPEEKETWRAIAKEGDATLARLIRTAIRVVDREKLIQALRQAA